MERTGHTLSLQGNVDSCGLAVYNNSIIGQLRWLSRGIRLPLWLMACHFKPAKALSFLGRIKESIVVINGRDRMSVKRYGHADLLLFGRVAGYIAASSLRSWMLNLLTFGSTLS